MVNKYFNILHLKYLINVRALQMTKLASAICYLLALKNFSSF